jgi:Flp pilus assembly protein TadD
VTPPDETNGAADQEPDRELLAELAEASAMADEGDWMAALNVLLTAEQRFPLDPTLLCMTGVALRETGADDVAYDYFRRCLAQSPADPQLLVTAGSEIARWDDPDAERVLRLAALTAPEMAQARLEYGVYLAREGHLDTSISELETARRLDPADPRTHLELGIALLRADRIQESLAELEEALSLAPEDDWLLAIVGLALIDSRSMEDAAERLRLASLARPHDWEIHGAAALGASAVGWEDEAWAALARAEAAPEADLSLLRDLEQVLEAGAEDAEEYLRTEVGPSLLRQRLVDRA